LRLVVRFLRRRDAQAVIAYRISNVIENVVAPVFYGVDAFALCGGVA
jgi:hypothetical protein